MRKTLFGPLLLLFLCFTICSLIVSSPPVGISTSVPRMLATYISDLSGRDLVADITCFGNETDLSSCMRDPERFCASSRSAAVRCIGKYHFAHNLIVTTPPFSEYYASL